MSDEVNEYLPAIVSLYLRMDKLERLGTDINLRRFHDAVELLMQDFNKRLSDIEEQIKKLKEAYHADAQVCKDIIFDGARRSEEIKEIKEHHNLLSQAVAVIQEWQKSEIEKNIQNQLIAKKLNPHKCPTCDGKGEIIFDWIADQDYKIVKKGEPCKKITTCNACEGKGIVWG